MQHGGAWYAQLHSVLDVETYLQTYYKADERVREAEIELAGAQAAGDEQDCRLKTAFRDRTLVFRGHQRRRLRENGVPAPSDGHAR